MHGQRWPTEYRVGRDRAPCLPRRGGELGRARPRCGRGAGGARCAGQRGATSASSPTPSGARGSCGCRRPRPVGAQLDTAADLLPLLNRRVPYSVPLPRGFLAVPEGRAVVYPYLHGRSVVLSEVIPGPGVAAEIGRAVAALHNVERAVFDEAGVPVYDAETCRTRHLGDLDRGAATGHVPTALLSRWERALEDVSAWRFAPTPVHADLSGGRFLVTFADDENPRRRRFGGHRLGARQGRGPGGRLRGARGGVLAGDVREHRRGLLRRPDRAPRPPPSSPRPPGVRAAAARASCSMRCTPPNRR